ncbi:hypothetical protein Dsin_013597 [Dipteronia sinensis]|uniref:Uncharacterized protein n=1 Tax=Dipteronia sinensis TaxID=43782 RepID=A0AAE0ALE7_9ROSI|nr:hypothetical protein Dsin_013597 [Dipteronia sinensis]
MGWKPSVVVQVPTVLNLNLEKRIIPRCSFIRVLVLKGLVNKENPLSIVLVNCDERFLDTLLIKYQDETYSDGHHRRWRPEDGHLPSATSKSSEEVKVVEVVEVDGQLPHLFTIGIANLSAIYHRRSRSGLFRRTRDAGSTTGEVEVIDVSQCSSDSEGFRFAVEIANPIVIPLPRPVLLLHDATNR